LWARMVHVTRQFPPARTPINLVYGCSFPQPFDRVRV